MFASSAQMIPKLGFSGVPSDINQASYADFYLCSVDCQG